VNGCYSTSNIEGSECRIGGLIGDNGGSIDNSYSTGTVVGIGFYVGGLIGENYGSANNCFSSSNVNGNDRIGGLIGANRDYKIVNNCYSTGIVSGTAYVGGLIGENYGFVKNCHSTGSAHGTNNLIGGLIGSNGENSAVQNCYSTADVEGNGGVGGLIGRHQGTINTQLRRSYSTGDVNGNVNVGGLLGTNDHGSVSNCYSMCKVDGNNSTGGLIGENYYGTTSNCHSAGPVSGVTNTGGLIGKRTYSTVSNCFWDTQTTEQANGVGISVGSSDGIYGRTTTQMKQQETFTASPYLWDFIGEQANGKNDYWRMCIDGVDYPRLTFEYIQSGDFACPDGVNYDDVSLLCSDWLLTYSRELYGADANGDMTVSFLDFAILAANWLSGE